MSYWDILPASALPARDLVDLGWSGLRWLAPHLTDPATYAPPPPRLAPTPEGKLPVADPPSPLLRAAGADFVHNTMNFFPGGGPPMRLAGLMGLVRGAPAARALPEMMASKSPMMYNPPVKPQRPFAADYPSGAPADAAGRLAADIEGRPLHARYVIGRSVVDGADQTIPPAEYDALATAILGRRPESVPAGQIGGDAGRYVKRRGDRLAEVSPQERQGDGWLRRLLLNEQLRPQQAGAVTAHEIGHAVDEIAGKLGSYVNHVPFGAIPQTGISRELKFVYNDINNPTLAQRRLALDKERAAGRSGKADVDTSTSANLRNFGPADRGYPARELPAELMAEAIRSYLADPNYLKTVAPKTAAVIREAVNSHPVLSKIIQFNTLAGLTVAGVDGAEDSR